MSTAPPPVGVVIVSFNTRELLRACLESLRACTLPLRVVVVDNASADGSAAMVREQFPDICLVETGRNAGFAAGTNVGLAHLGFAMSGQANGAPASLARPPDYALLLNPDTVVHPGAVEALVAFLGAHPRVGMAGPRLLDPDGSVQAAAFRFPTLLMTALDLFPPGEALPGRLYGSWWHGRYPQERSGEAPFPIDHPLGACILARRECVEQVGLLDEGFFMYAEEVDWCYRARRAGWAIWQVPQARVTHVGGAATSQFRGRMLVELYRSRLRFFAKHYPPWLAGLHRAIIRAGALRLTLLAWREHARGAIGGDELRARLLAYAQMMQL